MSREVMEQIKKHLDAAQQEVWAAEALADEHGVSFKLSLGGYGMGGTYDPNDREDEWGEDNGGWHASSQSC